MAGFEENHEERTHPIRYATFRRKERVAGRKQEKSGVARVFVTPEAAAVLLRLSYGASSHEKSQSEKDTTIIRRARVRRKSLPRVPEREVKVVFTSFAAKPAETRSKSVAQSETPASLVPRRRTRKARKRVPRRRALTEANGVEDYPIVQERTPRRDIVKPEAGTEVTYSENEGSQPSPGNRMIKTSSLRRFASEKLPSSSVLREVLMAENEKLTAEEFLAKLDIWLHLFKRDIGG